MAVAPLPEAALPVGPSDPTRSPSASFVDYANAIVATLKAGGTLSDIVAGLENGGYVVTWHGPSVQGGSDVQSRLFAVAGMVVEGASAADTLSGGSSADTFLAGNGSGADRIDNRGHGDDGDSVALATGIIASHTARPMK